MHTAEWLCLLTGWFLAGVSAVVAVVVYPAFDLVGESEWSAYHDQHSRRITMVVALPWLLEGVGTAWWLLVGWSWLAALHAIAAAATVALTVLGAVPVHNEITRGRSAPALRRLSRSNWWRAAAWLAAACLATASLA